ncbi:hypothetical protein MMC07_010007, partial [Pseudocyphellaria aurata]|nr:hypothetical protein [Pseudocyphellaria aurata]
MSHPDRVKGAQSLPYADVISPPCCDSLGGVVDSRVMGGQVDLDVPVRVPVTTELYSTPRT